jgi:hypothetical protein
MTAMKNRLLQRMILGSALLIHFALASRVWAQQPSIGGFIPFVGLGLTKQFETFEQDTTFFIADPRYMWSGPPLGPGSATYFDLALLDTGAATHILTPTAAGETGFSIAAEGLQGTNTQEIIGAGGAIDLVINDPLGVYVTGLGPTERLSSGASLQLNTGTMRGQSSVATLAAPTGWNLPNIIGLPMAAHHAIVIRNDLPQVFQHTIAGASRTVRTPQVEFVDLDTAGIESGIQRRTNLRLRPSSAFISGPFYLQNLAVNEEFEIVGHDNPLSPTVVESGGLYVEVDLGHDGVSIQNKEILFDTGADLTVLSEVFAASLGIDILLDTPDFFLEVEGAGGVSDGVPGFYVDELKIDAVGGAFVVQNVPVAVIDLPNPADPGNVVDAILGTHVFNGRNIAIDAIPAAQSQGGGPRLYIGDPVTQARSWATSAASASWATAANWNSVDGPGVLWAANVASVSGANQTAVVSANSQIYQLRVSGQSAAKMTLQINTGATLTTFGEARIDDHGRIDLAGGKLDAQVVNIHGGVLSGEGDIFVGTGVIRGQVRNLEGRIEPGDPIGRLSIDGDLSQQANGTLAIELGGLAAATQHDQLTVTRYAFLDGTLEVSLANAFTPSVGNSFTILMSATLNGIQGTFDHLNLPSGYLWDVVYGSQNVVLSVIGLGLAGDYNGDGTVNAADYTVWRNSLGSANSNADGNGSGLVDANDYLVWKNHYGQTASGASLGNLGNVPEPSACILSLIAAMGVMLARRGRASAS